jgi:GT2 family glycosyltransferase
MSLPAELNEQTQFQLSRTFRLLEDTGAGAETADSFFLQHTRTEGKVETDLIGKRILEQLPASAQQLVETFNSPGFYLSPKLIRYYLLLFWKAGILEPIEAEPSTHPAPHLDETVVTSIIEDAPAISVVIVTYNGKKFIRKNLESLYLQTLPAKEIIIVDNASSDGSIDEVEQEFKKVKVIRNRRNYHYAKAVNIGVEAASNNLVIILNQDIVLDKNFIRRLVLRCEAELEKEHIAGVVPQMRFSQLKNFINGIGNFVTEKNWGSDNYFGVVDIGQFKDLEYTGSACFGAILVTKQAWQTVGPLDKTFKSFYEDVDWSIRAHLKGMNLLTAPGAILYHAFGGSYPSGLKLTLVATNRMRFVLKHLKGKVRSKFFIKYLKQDIKNGLSFLRRKSYRNMFCYFKAYFKLAWELPNILFHMMRRDKYSEETVAAFFEKGTPYVAFSNKNLNPVINKHVIRSYYYYTELENFQFPSEPILLL